jgi:NAD(P)-dependent dehydrogenase (short-subunit alcohol dehydrogenase family)
VGFEVALGLARAGADIVIADVNDRQGRWAVEKIRPLAPASLVRFERIDLASLAMIETFAKRIEQIERPVDLLVNNAGILAPSRRQVTVDGFEMQLGTNFLGHFALTARLLPLLRRGLDPRVVQVGSLSHRFASINLDDLHHERRYAPMKAYGQSKLALLLFAFELQRRSDLGRWRLMSVAAHPGYARTALLANSRGAGSLADRLHRSVGRLLNHSAEAGALPILYAAAAPGARPGAYYGPKGFLELVGKTGLARIGEAARDTELAQRLWAVSEKLPGVTWP